MESMDVGMDVHKESITLAVLPAAAPAPTRIDTVPHEEGTLRRYLARVAAGGPFQVSYEASGTGFVLHRALTVWGHVCTVIAPSHPHQARRPAQT